MNEREDPAQIRLLNVIDMGLNFSATLRLYKTGSKKDLYHRILDEIEQLFQAESMQQFTTIHSRICNWGVDNICLNDGETSASYGQIAKTLDVVLKVVIYYCHLPYWEKSNEISCWLNAAVDTRMMNMLKNSYCGVIKPWPISVHEVNKESYQTIQGLVRRYVKEKHLDILPVQFDDIYWRKLNKAKVYSDVSS